MLAAHSPPAAGEGQYRASLPRLSFLYHGQMAETERVKRLWLLGCEGVLESRALVVVVVVWGGRARYLPIPRAYPVRRLRS